MTEIWGVAQSNSKGKVYRSNYPKFLLMTMPDVLFNKTKKLKDWKKNLRKLKKSDDKFTRFVSMIGMNCIGNIDDYDDLQDLELMDGRYLTAFEYFMAAPVSYLLHETVTISKEFKTHPQSSSTTSGHRTKPKSKKVTCAFIKWIFSHSLSKKLDLTDQNPTCPTLPNAIIGASNIQNCNTKLSPIKPRVVYGYLCM